MSERAIFVFGSNLAGRHGRGAALYALKHYGALLGVAEGRQGDSYAIPTKGYNLKPLSLDRIAAGASRFIAYARANPGLNFQLTAVATGLAGYRPSEVAAFFQNAPTNVQQPPEFKAFKRKISK